MKRVAWRDVIGVVVGVAIAQTAGLVGGIGSAFRDERWYAGLEKPPFNPPSAVFAPVWTTLYALIGASGYLIWRQGPRRPAVQLALTLWTAQLALNALWPIIFFRWQSLGWALLEICLLWALIVATLVQAFRVSKAAGWLLVPYLLWVTFALVLNFSIWWLNRR
jgi:benzodiazapine receptor